MTFADCLTVFRMMISPVLLWLTPFSAPFTTVYLLCGVSDMLDGFVARKTHTASKRGARLDSVADFEFLLICLIKLLPIWSIPPWLWCWSGLILLLRVAVAVRAHKLYLPHTTANKITGSLLFFLPLLKINICYTAIPACIAATVAAIEDGR